MALTACSECSGTVSDRATTCPHCGFPLEPETMSASSSPEAKETERPSLPDSRHPAENDRGPEQRALHPAPQHESPRIARTLKRIGLFLALVALSLVLASFVLIGVGGPVARALIDVASRLFPASLLLGFGAYATGKGLIWLSSVKAWERVLGVLALGVGLLATLWAILFVVFSGLRLL